MKKPLFIILLIFFINTVYSQAVYTENFDNHSVGNLGTDVTGKIPGQWGWFTYSRITQANSFFTIVNETGRGKVLDITTGLTSAENLSAFKTNLNTLIANRTAGNNVLMFEFDYYTGSIQNSNSNTNGVSIELVGVGNPLATPNVTESLAWFRFMKNTGYIEGSLGNSGGLFYDNQADYYYLPFNTWVKIIVYLDYPNKKGYFYIPYLNKVFAGDFLANKTSTNLIQDYVPATLMLSVSLDSGINSPLLYTRNRYDNIKITALNVVPPNVIALNTNEQLAAKFNMYPNPATNVVNITNSENMLVNQVTVYDIAGKQISTQSFNSEAEIQLNVENLANGTYMLHLQTHGGTAVKKLVKK